MVVIALPLLVLLAAFVAYGTASLTRTTSSGWIGWLRSTVIGASFIGGALLDQVLHLTSYVTHALGKHYAQVEAATAAWVSALADVLDRTGRVALTFPFDVSRFAYWLVRHQIPRLIHAIPGAATRLVHTVVKRVQVIDRTIVKLPKLSRAQAKALIGAAVGAYIFPYLAMLRWLRSHFHAMTAVLPHVLPIPLGRTITQIRKRLRRLERAVPGTAVFTGAVAVALGRLGIGWIRCNNVRRVGRELCGLNPRTITDLLGMFADVLILTNICRVFTVLQQGLGFVQPEITAFVGGVGAWACYGDREHPPRVTVPPLDLPASSPVHGLPV